MVTRMIHTASRPRVRPLVSWVALALLPVVLLSSLAPGSRASTGTATFDATGAIAIDGQFCISHAPVDVYDAHADNLASTGARSLRFNIEWFECARDFGKDTTVYNFATYDSIMAKLQARGIHALGCFVYGWGWWPNNKDLPREDWEDYLRFAHAFVSRYQGNITYQSWNEPNPAGRSFWRGTEPDFYEFLGRLVDTIRDAFPAAVILSPSLVGPDTAYLQRMIDHFGSDVFGEMFDIVSYHTYSGSNAEIIESKIDRVAGVLAARGLDQKPTWITEVGFSTKVASEPLVRDYRPALLDFQATFVVKTYAQAISRNVSSIYWYCLYDWCGETEVGGVWIDPYEGEANFGLFTCYGHYEFTMKPAGLAYQRLATLLAGGTWYPRGIETSAPPGARTWAYYFHTARNTTLVIAWTQGLATRARITPAVPATGITIHDYARNASTAMAGAASVDVDIGLAPVMVELETGPGGPVPVLLELFLGPVQVVVVVSVPAMAGAALAIVVLRRRGLAGKRPVKEGDAP